MSKKGIVFDEHKFRSFQCSRTSVIAYLQVMIVLTLLIARDFVAFQMVPFSYLKFSVIICLIGLLFSGWAVCSLKYYIESCENDKNNSSSSIPQQFIMQLNKIIFGINKIEIVDLLHILEDRFLDCSSIAVGMLVIYRSSFGDCGELNFFLASAICNPEYACGRIPSDITTIALLIPLSNKVLFKGASWNAKLRSAAVTVGLIICSVIITQSWSSLYFLFVVAPFTVMMLFELRRQNVEMFMLTETLNQSLQDNEKMAEELRLHEMKMMIGNIAHDLKTPLTAFFSGLDEINTLSHDLKTKLTHMFKRLRKRRPSHSQQTNGQPNDDFTISAVTDSNQYQNPITTVFQDSIFNMIDNIQHCIETSKSINSFMLMSINRCIDFTKVRHGVTLKSKMETGCLQDLLNVPLNCMRDMQSLIEIKLFPPPSSICSHIITDKQWFQENLLCLVSNAVKYSSKGKVTIKVSLWQPPILSSADSINRTESNDINGVTMKFAGSDRSMLTSSNDSNDIFSFKKPISDISTPPPPASTTTITSALIKTTTSPPATSTSTICPLLVPQHSNGSTTNATTVLPSGHTMMTNINSTNDNNPGNTSTTTSTTATTTSSNSNTCHLTLDNMLMSPTSVGLNPSRSHQHHSNSSNTSNSINNNDNTTAAVVAVVVSGAIPTKISHTNSVSTNSIASTTSALTTAALSIPSATTNKPSVNFAPTPTSLSDKEQSQHEQQPPENQNREIRIETETEREQEENGLNKKIEVLMDLVSPMSGKSVKSVKSFHFNRTSLLQTQSSIASTDSGQNTESSKGYSHRSSSIYSTKGISSRTGDSGIMNNSNHVGLRRQRSHILNRSRSSIISGASGASGLSFLQSEGYQQETHVRIEVEDQGIGIPPEMMEFLFSPFKQAQRLAGGTGLGLFSLAKRIESLNGYYGVEPRSDGQQGSVFWFSFPYQPDKASAKLHKAEMRERVASSDHDEPNSSFTSNNSPVLSNKQKSCLINSDNNGMLCQLSTKNYFSNKNDPMIESMIPKDNNNNNNNNNDDDDDEKEIVIYDKLTPSKAVNDMLSVSPLEKSSERSKKLETIYSEGNIFHTLQQSQSQSPSTNDKIIHKNMSDDSSDDDDDDDEIDELSKFVALNILIVDDSLPIRKVLTSMLKTQGHTVVTATNGAESLDRIAEQHTAHNGMPFDVILMDMQMPVMDGLEATRRIRAEEGLNLDALGGLLTEDPSSSSSSSTTIPKINHEKSDKIDYHQNILALSANSDDDTIATAFEVGVDEFMPKPFTIKSLYEKLQLIREKRKLYVEMFNRRLTNSNNNNNHS